MNIVVIGGHCRNKGAQLMLQVVAAELGRVLPKAHLFVTPLAGSPRLLHQMGYRLLDIPLPHVGSRIFPEILIRTMVRGSAILRDTRLVLDISGFAFSDQFGVLPLRNLDRLLGALEGTGTQFIMLPQSLGPFTKPDMADYFYKILERSALLCVRDASSLSHVRKVCCDDPRIQLFPDITLGYHAAQKTGNLADSNYCCLVPNFRMMDSEQGGKIWKESYIDLLRASAEHLHGKYGKKIYAVVHSSGAEDRRIAEKLAKEASIPVELVSAKDPVVLKQFFAKSCLVVGSRFHALASALSSGVPSVAWGWSHKYDELFREYEQEDCVFSSPCSFDVSLFDRLFIPSEYAVRCETIDRVTESKKRELDSLWGKVRAIALGVDS